MKNLLLFLFGSFMIISCGVSSKAIKKTVAIEKDCPRENIEILEKEKSMGRGTYKVDACGEIYIYKVLGNTISEEKK